MPDFCVTFGNAIYRHAAPSNEQRLGGKQLEAVNQAVITAHRRRQGIQEVMSVVTTVGCHGDPATSRVVYIEIDMRISASSAEAAGEVAAPEKFLNQVYAQARAARKTLPAAPGLSDWDRVVSHDPAPHSPHLPAP